MVTQKLKVLKSSIRSFSKDNYSNLENRVVEAQNLVLSCQRRTLSNPSLVNATNELEAQRKWHILSKVEESFFCQRSFISWLADGDSNTAFFHRMASTRKPINTIQFFQDENGTRIDTQEGIKDHCVDYFSNLLGGETGPPMLEQSDMELLLTYSCSQDQQSELAAGFTDLDIKTVFFSLSRNKSSGPDGYSGEFFKGMWEIVGAGVTDAVQEFFSSGRLLKQ